MEFPSAHITWYRHVPINAGVWGNVKNYSIVRVLAGMVKSIGTRVKEKWINRSSNINALAPPKKILCASDRPLVPPGIMLHQLLCILHQILILCHSSKALESMGFDIVMPGLRSARSMVLCLALCLLLPRRKSQWSQGIRATWQGEAEIKPV